MTEKIVSAIIAVITVGFVITNTLVLNRQADEILKKTEMLNLQEEDAVVQLNEAYAEFEAKVKYISISVNHEDLTNIEQCFAEIMGSLSVGDIDNAEITKYRLIDSLKHLRRLSGFTIDSVI